MNGTRLPQSSASHSFVTSPQATWRKPPILILKIGIPVLQQSQCPVLSRAGGPRAPHEANAKARLLLHPNVLLLRGEAARAPEQVLVRGRTGSQADLATGK